MPGIIRRPPCGACCRRGGRPDEGANNTPRIYFDANVLVAYIGNEKDRADVVQALLDEARQKRIEIITSVLSIAEVAYGAQEKHAGLTPAGEARIDQLWVPASPITLVDISEVTARQARTLTRSAKANGLSAPRSADALHLASALQFGATEIFTYEVTKRPTWHQLTGLPVSEPSVVNAQLDFGAPS